MRRAAGAPPLPTRPTSGSGRAAGGLATAAPVTMSEQLPKHRRIARSRIVDDSAVADRAF